MKKPILGTTKFLLPNANKNIPDSRNARWTPKENHKIKEITNKVSKWVFTKWNRSKSRSDILMIKYQIHTLWKARSLEKEESITLLIDNYHCYLNAIMSYISTLYKAEGWIHPWGASHNEGRHHQMHRHAMEEKAQNQLLDTLKSKYHEKKGTLLEKLLTFQNKFIFSWNLSFLEIRDHIDHHNT